MSVYRPPAKPKGLLRWGYRLPIVLYRARLGWLLGHRFLLLAHRGRKTSATRHTVLEVVHFVRESQESSVLSAYGDRADWYLNIQAHPPLEVRTGRSRYLPDWRLLELDERLETLRAYQQRYRGAFRAVMRFLGHPYDGSEESLRALAESVIMVAFRPVRHAQRPGASQNDPHP